MSEATKKAAAAKAAAPTKETVQTAAPAEETVQTAAPAEETVQTAAPAEETAPAVAPVKKAAPAVAPVKKAAPAVAPVKEVKNPVYKAADGTYEVLGKSFIYKQEKLNAKQAVKNNELMEALIANNSPAIKKQ